MPEYSPEEFHMLVRANLRKNVTRDHGGVFYVAYGPNNTYTYQETIDFESFIYMSDETDQDKMYFDSFDAGYHAMPWHVVLSRKSPALVVAWDHSVLDGVSAHIGMCLISGIPIPEYKKIRTNMLERAVSVTRLVPELPRLCIPSHVSHERNPSNRATKYLTYPIDIPDIKQRSKQAGVPFAVQALSDYIGKLFENLPESITRLKTAVTCLLEDDRDVFNTFSAVIIQIDRHDTSVDTINRSLTACFGTALVMNDMYQGIDLAKQLIGCDVSVGTVKHLTNGLNVNVDVIFTSMLSSERSNIVVHNTCSKVPFYVCMVDGHVTTSSNSSVYDISKFTMGC